MLGPSKGCIYGHELNRAILQANKWGVHAFNTVLTLRWIQSELEDVIIEKNIKTQNYEFMEKLWNMSLNHNILFNCSWSLEIYIYFRYLMFTTVT